MASEQRRWGAPSKSVRDLQRELAETIVKIILQNPALASSAQYDRMIEAIVHYTLAIGETK